MLRVSAGERWVCCTRRLSMVAIVLALRSLCDASGKTAARHWGTAHTQGTLHSKWCSTVETWQVGWASGLMVVGHAFVVLQRSGRLTKCPQHSR